MNYKTMKRFKLKYDFSSLERVKSQIANATWLDKCTLVKLKTHQFKYSQVYKLISENNKL